jgi:cytochrome c551/c552
VACHVSQRPATVISGFDHSLNGTGDCIGCHQATVASGKYLKYLPLPGGDWQGGVGYPGSTPVGSPNQFITVTEASLSRTGSLVTGSTSISATLYNMMLHVSTALPPELNAGPTATPDYAKCWHCHTNTSGTVTSYADGKYHSSLTSYAATPGGTVTPFPQPTNLCTDCHVQMRPTGIVMKAASNLQPMDHNALFAAPAVVGGVSVTGVAQVECAVCHHNPGVSWADGAPAQPPLFHANIGSAVPQDCATCHYPLMADATKSDLTNGTRYSMRHRSGRITFQSCQTCHTSALSKAANTPVAATLWQTGAYHAALATQPGSCVDCHAPTRPAASTQSSWSYTLALGSTSSNQAQWMNHASSLVAGKDCVVCHAADAKTSGSAWSKADKFHGPVATSATCKECHGLTNGGGSVAGTKNNLPAGLTNSTMLTSASADSSTGIAAGTHDQITHTDVNVSGRDCNFCHTQAGTSTASGIQGQEWAQASFHVKFTSASPLVLNGTTGRCSNCHMNVKPGATFTAFNHGALTAVSGTQDCSSCHSWPGTGSAQSPNWLGAASMPIYIPVGGFAITQPPATTATTQLGINNLPHPTVGTGVACTSCHATAAGGKSAIGYDHLSTLINSNCGACHEAGTNLIGTLSNGATSQSAIAGDSRPYTLTSVTARFGGSLNVTYPKHFYPVDCKQCHVVPTGNGYVTTGTAYTTAWKFPHSTSKMTNPSTCVMCHTHGIP